MDESFDEVLLPERYKRAIRSPVTTTNKRRKRQDDGGWKVGEGLEPGAQFLDGFRSLQLRREEDTQRSLKCPYYKRNPRLHQRTSCRLLSYDNMRDVKFHIERVHLKPPSCGCCHSGELCESTRTKLLGVNLNRAPFSRNSRTEKWALLYEMLFGNDIIIPSPYEDRTMTKEEEDLFLSILTNRLSEKLGPTADPALHQLRQIMEDCRLEAQKTIDKGTATVECVDNPPSISEHHTTGTWTLPMEPSYPNQSLLEQTAFPPELDAPPSIDSGFFSANLVAPKECNCHLRSNPLPPPVYPVSDYPASIFLGSGHNRLFENELWNGEWMTGLGGQIDPLSAANATFPGFSSRHYDPSCFMLNTNNHYPILPESNGDSSCAWNYGGVEPQIAAVEQNRGGPGPVASLLGVDRRWMSTQSLGFPR